MIKVCGEDEALVKAMEEIYASAGLSAFCWSHTKAVIERQASLWLIPMFGFAVVGVDPDAHALHVYMVHGRLIYDWGRPLLLELARREGCTKVTAHAISRPVARLLKRMGFVAGPARSDVDASLPTLTMQVQP